MAHHKSAKKRIRTNARRNVRNKTYLASVRTAVKKFRTAAIEGKDKEVAEKSFKEAQSLLASAAGKGIMHRNTVSRRISRLNALLTKVRSGEKLTAAEPRRKSRKKKVVRKKKATSSKK